VSIALGTATLDLGALQKVNYTLASTPLLSAVWTNGKILKALVTATLVERNGPPDYDVVAKTGVTGLGAITTTWSTNQGNETTGKVTDINNVILGTPYYAWFTAAEGQNYEAFTTPTQVGASFTKGAGLAYTSPSATYAVSGSLAQDVPGTFTVTFVKTEGTRVTTNFTALSATNPAITAVTVGGVSQTVTFKDAKNDDVKNTYYVRYNITPTTTGALAFTIGPIAFDVTNLTEITLTDDTWDGKVCAPSGMVPPLSDASGGKCAVTSPVNVTPTKAAGADVNVIGSVGLTLTPGANGTLTAALEDGTALTTNKAPMNARVVFKATPNVGYDVDDKSWKLNSAPKDQDEGSMSCGLLGDFDLDACKATTNPQYSTTMTWGPISVATEVLVNFRSATADATADPNSTIGVAEKSVEKELEEIGFSVDETKNEADTTVENDIISGVTVGNENEMKIALDNHIQTEIIDKLKEVVPNNVDVRMTANKFQTKPGPLTPWVYTFTITVERNPTVTFSATMKEGVHDVTTLDVDNNIGKLEAISVMPNDPDVNEPLVYNQPNNVCEVPDARNVVFTATAEYGYKITGWKKNGVDVVADQNNIISNITTNTSGKETQTYTILALSGDVNVEAIFESDLPRIVFNPEQDVVDLNPWRAAKGYKIGTTNTLQQVAPKPVIITNPGTAFDNNLTVSLGSNIDQTTYPGKKFTLGYDASCDETTIWNSFGSQANDECNLTVTPPEGLLEGEYTATLTFTRAQTGTLAPESWPLAFKFIVSSGPTVTVIPRTPGKVLVAGTPDTAVFDVEFSDWKVITGANANNIIQPSVTNFATAITGGPPLSGANGFVNWKFETAKPVTGDPKVDWRAELKVCAANMGVPWSSLAGKEAKTIKLTVNSGNNSGYGLRTSEGFALDIELPKPALAVDKSPVVFPSVDGKNGYNAPAPQTVTITNITNKGAVWLDPSWPTDKSTSILDAKGEPIYVLGPLTYVSPSTSAKGLAEKTGKATFTVRPEADLPIGVYDTIIRITGKNDNLGLWADDEASVVVMLSFEVTREKTFTIGATELSSFGNVERGYVQPKEKTVTITNTGSGTVTLYQPKSLTGNYIIGTLSSENLPPGAKAEFTVQPKAGLGAGIYDEEIAINGSKNVGAVVTAMFRVASSQVYDISVAEEVLFDAAEYPYTQPEAKKVTIKNTGTSKLVLTNPASTKGNSNYIISSNPVLTPGSAASVGLEPGDSATFTVRPKADLVVPVNSVFPYTFEEDIVFGAKETPGSADFITLETCKCERVKVAVSFTVTDKLNPVAMASVSPDSLKFGSVLWYKDAVPPYTPPVAKAVTVKNTGTVELQLSATVDRPDKYTIGELSEPELGKGKSAVFTVRPKDGLDADADHGATVTVSYNGVGGGGGTIDVPVTFAVKKPPVFTITASPLSILFEPRVKGYTQAPGVKTVTIKNEGATGTVTLNQPVSDALTSAFTLSPLSSTTVEAGGSVTFTVQPNIDLRPRSYNEDITITGSNGVRAVVMVSFTVEDAATYTISALPEALSFGALLGPTYAQPGNKTVTVTNTGTNAVTGLTVTRQTGSAYEVGNLASSIAVGGSANFTVRPRANLGIDKYSEVITITGANGVTAEVAVSFEVALSPKYAFSVKPDKVDFGSAKVDYATPPAAQTVTITNDGTSPLTLSRPLSSEYGATRYDIGTLSSTTVPVGGTATFTVRPKAGSPKGSYTEKIDIRGVSGPSLDSSAIIEVKFNVTDVAERVISVSPDTVSFGTLVDGYTPPGAKTVTITNIGTDAVTLKEPVDNNDFIVGALSRTTIQPGATATFTVRPKPGRPVGLRLYPITIQTDEALAKPNPITRAVFTVIDAPVHRIAADPTDVSFGALVAGYTPPTAKTIEITALDGTVALNPLPAISPKNYFVLGALSPVTITQGGAAAKFTVQPQKDLPVGDYDDVITVTGSNKAEVKIAVSFKVVKDPVYAITATELLPFGSLLGPSYTPPAAQTVTVTNTGTSTVTLTKPTAVNYTIGNLSVTSLAANATATFTVQPKAGLNFGDYSETITISGSNGTGASVHATFAVVTTAKNELSASDLTSFGTVVRGSASPYYTPPAAQTVTVTNTGTSAVTLLKAEVLSPTGGDAYIIGALTETNLTAGGRATFTVQPKGDLASDDYEYTIRISGKLSDGVTEVRADVKAAFYVRDVDTEPLIDVSTLSPFDAVQTPYTQPAAKTVTILNIGTVPVTLKMSYAKGGAAVTSLSSYIVSGLSRSTIQPGASATFTVQPKADLPVGVYNDEDIVIDYLNTNKGAYTIRPWFRVTPAPGIAITKQPKEITDVYIGAIADTLKVSAEVRISNNQVDPTAEMKFTWYRVNTAVTTGGSVVKTETGKSSTFPIPANLTAGTYYYYVIVSSPGAADVKSVLATVNVSSIMVSQLEEFAPVVEFDEDGIPYIPPASQTVTVTNMSAGAITLQQPASSVTSSVYTISALSSTSLARGAAATFTVRPNRGLKPGAYNEMITIRGNNGAIAVVTASFTVYSVPTVKISLSKLEDFGTLPTPYRQPAMQTVIVTNTGTEPVTLDMPYMLDYYEIGPLMKMVNGKPADELGWGNLLTNGAKAIFTVRPKPWDDFSMGEGDKEEDILVTATDAVGSAGSYPAKVTAKFAVEGKMFNKLSASPLSTFGHVYSTPYTLPAQQIVTIWNTGKGPITNIKPPQSVKYSIGALSAVNLAVGTSLTFTIRPISNNLPVGNHDEEITVSGTGVTVDGDETVSVVIYPTFTVAPVRTITAVIPNAPFGNFGIVDESYTQPDAQTVVITNTCDSVVTLTQPVSANYVIGALSKITLTANGDTASFTVRPKAGLASDLYDDAIIVACGPGGASVPVPVLFTVKGNATPDISVDPKSVSFGTLRSPYVQPGALTVTITSRSSAPITLAQPASVTGDYIIGALSTTTLPAKGSKATFTVQPKAGLGIGNHDSPITIRSLDGAVSATVTAVFTVTDPNKPVGVYTITFNPMNGEMDPTLAEQKTVNSMLMSLPVAIKSGYTLEGWVRGDGRPVTTSTQFTGDETVFANWVECGGKEYTLSYRADVNGSVTAEANGVPKESGEQVSSCDYLVFTAVPIDGYHVVSWTYNGAVIRDTTRTYMVTSVSRPTTIVVKFDRDVSIASPDRVVPTAPGVDVSSVAPVQALSAGLTAGPVPAERGGTINFYRSGHRVGDATLYIFDASGKVVKKIYLTDKTGGHQTGRKIGAWNLKDKTGRQVPEGTYVARGVLKTPDGKREHVSLVVVVR